MTGAGRLWTLAALTALPLWTAASDFHILETKSAGNGWAIEWSGTPGPALEYQAVPFVPADEKVFDPLALDVEPDREALDRSDRELVRKSAATSCLIAVTDPFGSYSVSAFSGNGTDVSSAVTVQPVGVGTVDAIQVVLDTGALSSDAHTIRIEVRPDTKAAQSVSGSGVRITDQRFLRGLFLNGADMTDTLADSKGAPVLPQPPGEWRLEYDAVQNTRPLEGEILELLLTDIGYNASNLDDLRFVYNGTAIPFRQINGNRISFYAPRTHTIYNHSDSVFATLSVSSPSPRIATREAFSTLSPQGAEISIPRSYTVTDNSRYERDAINAPGERFVFWRASAGQIKNDAVTVHDRLTTTAVRLEAHLLGLNQVIDVAPDHYVDLSVNGMALPRDSWNDRTDHITSGTLHLSAIPTPPAALTFSHAVPSDSPVVLPPISQADLQNLESYTVEYEAKPRADGSGVCRVRLEDGGGTPRIVTVGGFAGGTSVSDVLILDITDPLLPVEVINASSFTDEDGGVAIEFEDSGTASVYHLQLESSLQSPMPVIAETLPAVPAAGTPLRGIYVRPSEFASTLAPLVSLRGPGIIELEPRAAYNAYSDGRTSPEAIRLALADLIAAAPEKLALPEVLIVAHGTFDSRDYADAWVGPKVPVWYELGTVEYNGSNREYPSDLPYSLLFGSDLLPDVMIGRLTVRTTAQLQNAIDRYLAYEAALPTLKAQQRLGYILTDNTAPENFIFGFDAPLWISYWQGTQLPHTHFDFENNAAARDTVRAALEGPNGGVAFCLYVGHGLFKEWSDAEVLTTDDILNVVDTDGQWPFAAPMTCQNGIFAVPPVQETLLCMSDAWLVADPVRGGIGSISTTTEESYLALRPIVEEVMRGFQGHDGVVARTTGELFAMGMISYMTKFPFLADNARGYLLFGDPGADIGFEYPPNAGIGDWRSFDETWR